MKVGQYTAFICSFIFLLGSLFFIQPTYALVLETDGDVVNNTSLNKNPNSGGGKGLGNNEVNNNGAFTPNVQVPTIQGGAESYDIFKNAVKQGMNVPTISTKGDAFGTATEHNTYSFINDKQIKNKKGNKTINWTAVLAGKELAVAKEVVESAKSNYKVNTISGDLDLTTGDTLWGTKDLRGTLESLGRSSLVRITVNNDFAYLEVHHDSGTNITNSLLGIDQYKDAVRHGVITGGMVSGFNLYNLYSQYNVVLSEILTNTDGSGELKSNGNLKYSSEIFFHPVLGKLKIKDISNGKTVTHKSLNAKASLIQITHVSKNKVSYTISDDFKVFNDSTSQERGFFTKVNATNTSVNGGVTEYVSKYNTNLKRTLSGIADTTVYLSIPTAYSLETSRNSYILKDNGYKVIDGLRLVLHKGEVYEDNGGELKLKGKFSDYGLNPKEMVLYKTTKDGGTVGAVIPLRYKEVIYNPSDGKTHYTGRSLILNGDFKKNIDLDVENKDIFGMYGEMLEGEKIVNFAFPEKSSYKDAQSHVEVKKGAGVFSIQTDYLKPNNGASIFGAIIVRNNQFAKDNKLLDWLDTSTAKSMEGVDADLLKKLILGEMKVEEEGLSYEEWLRLQDIKTELKGSWEQKFKTWLFKLLILAGFLLIVYSILFTLLWFLDIYATFTEVSLLNIITMGRCYPIERLEYANSSGQGEGLWYITLYRALLTTTFGVLAGGLFMTVEPVMDFLIWVYFYITELASKVG